MDAIMIGKTFTFGIFMMPRKPEKLPKLILDPFCLPEDPRLSDEFIFYIYNLIEPERRALFKFKEKPGGSVNAEDARPVLEPIANKNFIKIKNENIGVGSDLGEICKAFEREVSLDATDVSSFWSLLARQGVNQADFSEYDKKFVHGFYMQFMMFSQRLCMMN